MLSPARVWRDHTTSARYDQFVRACLEDGALSWLIVVLVLLVAFGPVLWLMPSRRDRVLARMRMRARTHGVRVELVQIDDPDPAPEARVTAGGKRREPKLPGTAYRLPLARAASLAPVWSIVRATREAGPKELPGWQWRSAPAGDASYWQDVARVLSRAPADVFSCEAAPESVSFVWHEKIGDSAPEDAVDGLVAILAKLAEIQRIRHAAREEEMERQRLELDEPRGRSS
jgi:hypothetical protein